MSAFGGTADMALASANDPKRTLMYIDPVGDA